MQALHEKVKNSGRVGDVCEQVIIQLYRRVLEADSQAVDGGANVGWHTFQMAERVGSGCVYAYEPVPKFLTTLTQRAAKFGARVKILPAALSDRGGSASFVYFDEPDPRHPDYPDWYGGLSSLAPPERHMQIGHQILTVPTVTLDATLAPDIARLDFIKLDLEGAEFHALRGGLQSIRRFRPVIVFEDGGPGVGRQFGYGAQDLPDLLADLEYRLYDALGGPYSWDSWIKRDRWRPHYSLALPAQYQRFDLVEQAVQAAVTHFGI